MASKAGWYVSDNDETIGEGPFPTREAAIAFATEDREEFGREDGEAYMAHLSRCIVPEFNPSGFRFVAEHLLEDLHEDMPDLCVEEGWPEMQPEDEDRLERGIKDLLELHLRAAGLWPRVERVKQETVEIPAKPAPAGERG